jgi:plastocyanin
MLKAITDFSGRRRRHFTSVIALAVVALGCGGGGAVRDAGGVTGPIAPPESPAPPSATPPNAVTTDGAAFTPSTITVAQGATVTWQIVGNTHNVTFGANKPTGGDAPNTPSGGTITRTFPTAGTYTYQCTLHTGMSGTVIVQGTTAAVFTSVVVTPATPSISVGATASLSASALDQDGNAIAGLPAATWASSNNAVATVNASGVVTGVTAGSATITASMNSGAVTKTGTATITVTAITGSPTVNTVATPNRTFSPAVITIPAGGTVTWQFSAATHNVTFATLKPTGGDIPDTNPGNAVSRTFPTAGTYNYECTWHAGMTGQVVVTGGATPPPTPPPAPVFTSVAVTPATPSINVGATSQLSASALDQNGSAIGGLPAATWVSSNASVATVSGSGLVTGVAGGSATITASMVSGGVTKTGTATVTVTVVSAGSATVTTPNSTFTPRVLTIVAGTVVTWQFSGQRHNVTFGSLMPAGGNIGNTDPGNAVSRTFATPGTYDYQCTRHSGMTGQVVVTK